MLRESHHHPGAVGGSHAHGHNHTGGDFGRVFAIGITLNLIYVLTEAYYGVVAHSLALLADAGHNLSDVLGLAAAWTAYVLSRRAPSERYTYGLRSTSILVALANAVVLLIVTGGIAWEAIRRFADPEPVQGTLVMGVAAIGIVVNAGTAFLFYARRNQDLNIRGAFLHMTADALVTLGVIVAGGLIILTRQLWIDPAISLLISVVIVASTWSLLRDSVNLALHAVPQGIDRAAVERYLAGLTGVKEVHDLHIWAMSTTETALTAHLVRIDAKIDDKFLKNVVGELEEKFGIGHATLQLEAGDVNCSCDLG
jgi:cobalt-zinc-cadmium efflux system protein